MTKDKYNSIKVGMTYDQIKAIVGGPANFIGGSVTKTTYWNVANKGTTTSEQVKITFNSSWGYQHPNQIHTVGKTKGLQNNNE